LLISPLVVANLACHAELPNSHPPAEVRQRDRTFHRALGLHSGSTPSGPTMPDASTVPPPRPCGRSPVRLTTAFNRSEALAGIPAVLRADAVTGPDDVPLQIAAADARDLQSVLRTLPRIGARRVTILLRLESVKAPSPVPTRTLRD
jgi:AsnC-like helix-turn-helix protein